MARKKKISKHNDPKNPLVFKNWKKAADEIVEMMPRGQECAAADCENPSQHRNAFLCRACGVKYYTAFKDIVSTSERARAQYNWLKENVLVEDPE